MCRHQLVLQNSNETVLDVLCTPRNSTLRPRPLHTPDKIRLTGYASHHMYIPKEKLWKNNGVVNHVIYRRAIKLTLFSLGGWGAHCARADLNELNF